jgi:hypothetical protein
MIEVEVQQGSIHTWCMINRGTCCAAGQIAITLRRDDQPHHPHPKLVNTARRAYL